MALGWMGCMRRWGRRGQWWDEVVGGEGVERREVRLGRVYVGLVLDWGFEDERSGVCQGVVFCGCCCGWFPAWRLLIYMLDFESRTKR